MIRGLPFKARLLLWCSLLGFATMIWVVLHLTAPLPGQELSSDTSAATEIRAVTRVFVDEFDGGENSRQLRAMLIDQLRRIGSITITENPDRADAYLRGFAEDLVINEQHSRDENMGGRASISVSRGGNTQNRRAASQSSGVNESTRERATERRHEAALTVRIVNTLGDVLWTASAESRGGKYRSAAADVSARIAADLQKALRPAAGKPPSKLAKDSED